MDQEPKGKNSKNIITIIFLILMPIVGLILTWLITTWSKKTKIIITIVIALILVVIVILIFISTIGVTHEVRDITKDSRIRTQLSQIRVSAEIHYYDREGFAYLGLCENPETVNILEDIAYTSGKKPFCGADRDAYCVHAQLVSETGKYVCISSSGLMMEEDKSCTVDLECR